MLFGRQFCPTRTARSLVKIFPDGSAVYESVLSRSLQKGYVVHRLRTVVPLPPSKVGRTLKVAGEAAVYRYGKMQKAAPVAFAAVVPPNYLWFDGA